MMMSAANTPISAAIFDHTLAEEGSREIIKSRFGEIVIDVRNSLSFPKGLLGMPQAQQFALAHFPSEKMAQFKMLQCMDDFSLSFITLPLPFDNGILSAEHITIACREMGIPRESLVLLLIVCVHRQPEGTKLSVNARAPIFIDASRRLGGQYVFVHDQYKVQHFIS
jgi:flagellar assembly factor FliW